MRNLVVLLALLFLFDGCKSAADANVSSASGKRYPLKGKVVSVDKAAKKAKIDHEKIDGFMDACAADTGGR